MENDFEIEEQTFIKFLDFWHTFDSVKQIHEFFPKNYDMLNVSK